MTWENGVYISDPVPELFPHRFSIGEVEEIIPDIVLRVQRLLDSSNFDDFIRDRDIILTDLSTLGFSPKDIYVEKNSQQYMALELFLTAIFMSLLAGSSGSDSSSGKRDSWGNPYTGKRRNKIRNHSGFNF